MKIGDLDLGDRPLLLAPMEDVTDLSFRYVCKKFGADMMYTEFISSDGLIRDVPGSLYKLKIFDYERPIGMQIYGHIPEAMVESALRVEAAAPDVIDINFGCPVNKVVDAVRLPVTVKTRLGWDEDSKIIVELAERLQDVGIKAITIHGRTRCQMYRGEADWTLIGEVKRNPRMHIPVIGNGDIRTPQDAAQAFERYGVDGVMIGRASFGHPWIFREIRHFLETGEELPPMGVDERVALAKEHFAKSLEFKGERTGVLEMRRHLSCYFKGLPDFKETRLRLVTENDPARVLEILDYIGERWGEAAAATRSSLPSTTL